MGPQLLDLLHDSHSKTTQKCLETAEMNVQYLLAVALDISLKGIASYVQSRNKQ